MGIQIGSIVTFTSGGPKMIVSSISNDKFECQWFSIKGKLNTSEFTRNELIPIGHKITID